MKTSLRELKVELLATSTLKPYENNPRTHPKEQIEQIMRSMSEFGWTAPILIDEDNRVLAGHARLIAGKKLGLATVPAIRVASLTEAQKRAYIIADNKLAENAGWDRKLLAVEFKKIAEIDLDFDPTISCSNSAPASARPAPANQAAPAPYLLPPANCRHGVLPESAEQPDGVMKS